jgi:fatty acid desaturase
MTPVRRLIAVLCLATILVAAIHPVAPVLFLGLLVPLFFFVAPAENAVAALKAEDDSLPTAPLRAGHESRGPPDA